MENINEAVFQWTGKTAKGLFAAFYRQYGLDLTGYPITDEYVHPQSGLNSQEWQRLSTEEWQGAIRLRLVVPWCGPALLRGGAAVSVARHLGARLRVGLAPDAGRHPALARLVGPAGLRRDHPSETSRGDRFPDENCCFPGLIRNDLSLRRE